jgi:putative oxidoreductase
MKIIANIAGVVLGLLFLMASVMFFLKLGPQPNFPDGSPPAHYMAAFGPTGLMHFVKVFELLGGILVAIPVTRNFGLLVLGPIVLNILAFNIFIMKGEGMTNPMFILVIVLPLFLLWVGRKQFAGLLNCTRYEGEKHG